MENINMMTYRASGDIKIELVVRATDKKGVISFANLDHDEVEWSGGDSFGIKGIETNAGANREARKMLEDLQKI